MKFKKITSMALALIMTLSIQVFTTSTSVLAETNDGKEPWNIELFNDPILRDADGNLLDKGNPWWNADPEIHRFDGKFWIYATRSAPYERQLNQDCFSSDDLITWTRHSGYIDEGSLPDSYRSYWAPTVAYKDGYYYALFGTNDLNTSSAANDHTTGNPSGMYLLRSETPDGPFKQFMGKNVPLIPDNYFGAQAIDANMFLDDDNTMYLVYGGWSQCLMAKFKDDMTGFVPLTPQERGWRDSKTTVDHFLDYFINLTPVGGTTILGDLNYNNTFNGTNETYVEGPIMYKIDGLYYLMYSVGGWTTDTYGLRYAISRNPLGPFVTIPGRILQTRYSASSRGAGHNAMVYIEENDTWLCCYHRRPIGGGTNDRYTALDVVNMYDGQVMFPGETEYTNVRLFEPLLATKYWSAEDPLPKNLAQFRPIGPGPVLTASGSSNAAWVGRAHDTGVNTVSFWQSNNANAGHWLQVDFGEAKTYNEINVYLNQLGSSNASIDAATRIQFQSSNDGANWTDLTFTGTNPGRVLSAAERVRRDTSYFFVREALANPVTSRYVRLYFPDAQTVGVHEFEVYNIENVKQLIGLQNMGAKIEEVSPGTIPASAMAQLAGTDIPSSNAEQTTLSQTAAQPYSAIAATDEAFEGASLLALAADIGDPISSMAVVPGSGQRGSTDPWVVYDNGYYYYVKAENETSITVSKARRLEDIGKAGKTTVWAPDFDEFKLLRAPRLHKLGNKWYLYVSASDGDDHRVDRNLPTNLWNENYSFDIYAFEADSPLGPYTMKGIVNNPEQWAVDGTVLEHPNGKDYFVWSGRMGEEPEDPNGPAKLVKVSSSTTSPGDQGVEGMFDGLTTTKLYTGGQFVDGANQAPNGGLNVDMEYSKPITISRFRIGNAADSNSYTGRQPRAFTLRGSNDGVNWDAPFFTTTNAGLPTTNQALTYFDLSAPVTYQYYRWNITATGSGASPTANGGFQCSEFNLITPDGDMPLLPSAGQPKQALFIQEMTNPWTLAAGGRSMISEPTLSWEMSSLTNLPPGVNEGPATTVRDDGIYILYSGNSGTHTTGGIGMLSANATSDPTAITSWTKSANRLFYGGTSTTVGTNGTFYVRQPCLVKSADGSEDWLLYQANANSYGNQAAGPGSDSTNMSRYLNSKKDRSVRIQKIIWNNGAPSFAVATSGTAANAGNAALTSQTFDPPSGGRNIGVYKMEAEDAVLSGVINTDKNAATGNRDSGMRATTGITNAWMKGGRQDAAGSSQGSANGGWGTYWNASGGLVVRLGQNGAARFDISVDRAGTYNLTVMGVGLEYNGTQIINVNGTPYEMVHTLYSQRYGGLFTPSTIAVDLAEGANVITITNKAASVGAVIDYIYLEMLPDNISANSSIDIFTLNPYYSEFEMVSDVNMTFNMIIAEYNSRGALVSIDVRPIALTADVPLTESVVYQSTPGNNNKVYFWDNNFVPLSNAVSYSN